MGYDTKFYGSFKLDKPLEPLHRIYINALIATHMNVLTYESSDAKMLRESVNLPDNRNFYVIFKLKMLNCVDCCSDSDELGLSGVSKIDHLKTPIISLKPQSFCDWMISDDGTQIVYNEGCEKFKYYFQWIEFIVQQLLIPWGYKVNGSVCWFGDDEDDYGTIIIKNNILKQKNGVLKRMKTKNNT